MTVSSAGFSEKVACSDGPRKTARPIEEAGGEALTLACDGIGDDDVQSALDGTVQAFGRPYGRRPGRRRRPDRLAASRRGVMPRDSSRDT